MATMIISPQYQHEPVHLTGWMIAQLPGGSHHIVGPSDLPGRVRFSSPLVLLDFNAMDGITETGRRYDLAAPRLDHTSAIYERLKRYSKMPQPVAWSEHLFSTPQTLLPSLLHPSGPKQLQFALEKIESLRGTPDSWAPKLEKLLALLGLDPAYHHQAVGLDQDNWRRALRGDLSEVLPRIALNAWLIPEILALAYSFGNTTEWLSRWLHGSKARIGIYSAPKQLLLAGDTGALVALFRRLFLEAYR